MSQQESCRHWDDTKKLGDLPRKRTSLMYGGKLRDITGMGCRLVLVGADEVQWGKKKLG